MSEFQSKAAMSEWKVSEVRQPSSDFLFGAHAESFHKEAMESDVVVFEMQPSKTSGREMVQSQAPKEQVAA